LKDHPENEFVFLERSLFHPMAVQLLCSLFLLTKVVVDSLSQARHLGLPLLVRSTCYPSIESVIVPLFLKFALRFSSQNFYFGLGVGPVGPSFCLSSALERESFFYPSSFCSLCVITSFDTTSPSCGPTPPSVLCSTPIFRLNLFL